MKLQHKFILVCRLPDGMDSDAAVAQLNRGGVTGFWSSTSTPGHCSLQFERQADEALEAVSEVLQELLAVLPELQLVEIR